MSQSSPLVTVITPAYNQADYLAETIDSILAQDYPNVEYIVLDDGSPDRTTEVLEQFTGRIIWESQSNMGEPRTVNKGFEMATGDYVMVVNADDPLLPGAISRQVAYMEAHPNVLATYPDYVVIDEHSAEFDRLRLPDYDHRLAVGSALCLPGPGALIRRDAIARINGRDTGYRFVSDMDFWFRLGLHGDITRIPEFLAIRRDHSQARGVALRSDVGEEIVAAVEGLFARDDLPAEIARLRNQALSSAHYEAGIRAETYRERHRHFLRAFLLYPRNWIIHRHYRSLWILGAILLPEVVYKLLRPLFLPYKWFASYRRKSGDKAAS